ncbi:MAG: AI-2E family transporter [Dethiobacter sp.]|jgi:predicted PurR-regulated permease PerM|nr:MAG: AI-2E family transporter [Dethiobacter sp.]
MKDRDSKNALKVVALIALMVGFIWFLNRISWVIELCIISLLIVCVLFPVTEFLKKRFRFSHFLAVGITFLFFILIIVTLIGLIVPVVQREVEDILRDFPFYVRQIQQYIEEFSEFLLTFDLSPEFMETIPELSANLQPILEEIASVSVSLVSSIVDIFFIIFIVFYLLYDFHNVRKAVLKLIPYRYERYAEDVIRIIDVNFGGYIRGNIVRCTIVGLLTGFVLYFFGMPYALLLGILAGVLNIILYIGPYIAAIPAVILSFSPQTPSTITIIVIYILVQIIDGTLLSPLLLGRAVRLKPITVIVSLLIGQQLAGFLGMILSTPFAGIIRSLMEYIQEERKKNVNAG